MEVVGGCIVSLDLENYVWAYNNVVYDQIAAKFGPNAVQTTETDAWRIFKASPRDTSPQSSSPPPAASPAVLPVVPVPVTSDR
jgi:hypothetical protein